MNELLSMGLIGSVVGIVLKSIFDLVAKRKEHQYQRENLTQKDLFDKKVTVAEAAVSQFTYLKSIIYIIRETLDILIHGLKGNMPLIDVDGFNTIINGLEPLIERAKSYDTSSVGLYFDIKEDIGNHDLIQSLFTAYYAIMSLHHEMKSKNNNTTKEDNIRILTLFVSSLVLVSKLLKSIENDLDKNLRIIKFDMKEFKAI